MPQDLGCAGSVLNIGVFSDIARGGLCDVGLSEGEIVSNETAETFQLLITEAFATTPADAMHYPERCLSLYAPDMSVPSPNKILDHELMRFDEDLQKFVSAGYPSRDGPEAVLPLQSGKRGRIAVKGLYRRSSGQISAELVTDANGKPYRLGMTGSSGESSDPCVTCSRCGDMIPAASDYCTGIADCVNFKIRSKWIIPGEGK